MDTETLARLRTLAEQVAQREGCVLYDLELVGHGRGRVLRVFIERPDASQRVSLEDCTNVSKGLNLILDVEDVVPGGGYNLEVSSPGLERHLRSREHFASAVGSKVRMHLRKKLGDLGSVPGALQSAKRIEVEVSGASGDQIAVNIKGFSLQIPLAEIDRAKVIFDFEKLSQPKEKRK